jgi:hypothetical protein
MRDAQTREKLHAPGMGGAVGADPSQADGYPEFRAKRESDINMICIGQERCGIPDHVLDPDYVH